MRSVMRRAEATRTELDTAVGVLMGRRHCSAPTAFAEIAEAVRQTGIGATALSRALISLASGVSGRFDHRDEVESRWGEVLGLAKRAGGADPSSDVSPAASR